MLVDGIVLQPLFHFANATLESLQLACLTLDVLLSLVKLPVEVGDGIVKAEDVGKLLGERASDGGLGATAVGLPVVVELSVSHVLCHFVGCSVG